MNLINGEYSNIQFTDASTEFMRSVGVAEDVINSAEFDAAKTKKLKELERECSSRLGKIANVYPEHVSDTFNLQRTEAALFTADNTYQSDLLTAMSLSEQVSIENIVGRINDKAKSYAISCGEIIGKWNRMSKTVEMMKIETHTIEELNSIKWPEQ